MLQKPREILADVAFHSDFGGNGGDQGLLSTICIRQIWCS